MKVLVVYGPNLNRLGKRDPEQYGTITMAEINRVLEERAAELKIEVTPFQSNSEGALIDILQEESDGADGIIINPGALTHYGLSLRDALADTGLPIVEVHLSNIHARERFRRRSVVAPIAQGQIAGLGWRGFTLALEYLAETLKESDQVPDHST